MPTYYVTMSVDFAGHLEADSQEEAEQKAWTAWGDTADAQLTYDGVQEINAELDDDAWCEEHEAYDCAYCEDEDDSDD